jgi:hypothetical protein
MSTSAKEIAISNLIELSKNQEDIFATIIFGSMKTKDIFSDIDVFFFTKTPRKYLTKNDDWLADLGKCISKLDIINPIENVMISRIMLESYVMLDVIPIDYTEFKQANLFFMLKKYNATKLLPNKMIEKINISLRAFYHYIRNDYSIIYDKGNVEAVVKNVKRHFDAGEHFEYLYLTNKDKFYQNYNEFWQLAFKTVGLIVRGEIYYAVSVNDNLLKSRLIEMIEWYSFSFENKTNLNYKGKGVHSWANDVIKSRLKKIFSFEGQLNSYESIESTVNLYLELSHKLMDRFNYEKNNTLESKVLDVIFEYKKILCRS